MSRAAGAVARRLGRPELLAAVDADARQALLESVGVRASLVSALPPDGTYVDVGTNRGQVLSDAVRVAPRGRHIAFEPIPALAAEVASTFPTVDCRRLALAAERGVAQFCHFRKLDGWSGLRRSPAISDERGAPEYITVEVSTLDTELDGITPDVVKVDVEGAELGVLEGGRTVLARARPVVILEHVSAASELYGVTSQALWELLDDLDYQLFAVSGEGPFGRSDFARERRVVNWLARPATASGASS
ncbi:MAG TPA: FkbM family methyltransferase [Solirubrobacteraceae bacterium]|nr:FkbM family methyltransferase [Solirubrobacteraceae bacterium]